MIAESSDGVSGVFVLMWLKVPVTTWLIHRMFLPFPGTVLKVQTGLNLVQLLPSESGAVDFSSMFGDISEG